MGAPFAAPLEPDEPLFGLPDEPLFDEEPLPFEPPEDEPPDEPFDDEPPLDDEPCEPLPEDVPDEPLFEPPDELPEGVLDGEGAEGSVLLSVLFFDESVFVFDELSVAADEPLLT